MRQLHVLRPVWAAKLKRLTIHQKMRAGFAVVTAFLALLCGTIVWDSVNQFQQSSADLRGFELVQSAMSTSNTISAERGPSNNRLANLKDNDAEEVRGLSDARTRTDRALDHFRRIIAQAGMRNDEQTRLVHVIDAIRTKLGGARREIDDLAAKPIAERSAEQISHAQSLMFAIADAMTPLTDDITARTAMSDPDTADEIILSRLLCDLREYSGRLGSLFIAPLLTQQAIDSQRLADIMSMRGRIDQLRGLISGIIRLHLDHAGVFQDFEQLNAVMNDRLLPLVESMIVAGRTATYTMTAADFSKTIVPNFKPAERLRDRMIEIASHRAVASRDEARMKVALSMIALMLSITVLFVLARGTQRLLLTPFDLLCRQIIAISNGDIVPVAPPRGTSPEIVRVHDALDILRRSYARRELLERQRGDMITLFSHDMRAPLTSLIVLVTEQAQYRHDYPMQQRLGQIEKLARHTLAMADGFVQVSRAEVGEFERVPLNIADLLNEARDAIWPIAHEKHIEINDVPRRDDVIVLGDPTLLSRAFINLLDNAVKYSARHMRIKCSVELTTDRSSVRCVICDHGYGIDVADQPYLFERYRRFRLKGQPEAKGVGLGMAFVKTVVDRHDGDICVRSAAWHGTTVTTTLPALRVGDGAAGDHK